MNKLKGTIIDTTTVDQFSKVTLEVSNEIFVSIVIAVSDINPSLSIGNSVNILFKETDVTLCAQMPASISITNKIPVVVKGIESGVLFCRFIVNFNGISISAVVPSDFGEAFKVGDNLVLLIRSNEIMLMK